MNGKVIFFFFFFVSVGWHLISKAKLTKENFGEERSERNLKKTGKEKRGKKTALKRGERKTKRQESLNLASIFHIYQNLIFYMCFSYNKNILIFCF